MLGLKLSLMMQRAGGGPLIPADLAITLSRTSGPAPLGVHASLSSASASEDKLRSIWRDCLVLWDFGAAEDYTYRHHPADSRAARTARYKQGPFTGHVYRAQGGVDRTVTISCTVIHPSDILNPVTLTSPTITVNDPDLFCGTAWTDSGGADTVDEADATHLPNRTGNHTGVLSTAVTPDWTGAPANAIRFTTLSAALTWVLAKPAFSRRRLLFKAGETYQLSERTDFKDFTSLGRWGEGANPVFERDPAWFPNTDPSFWQVAKTSGGVNSFRVWVLGAGNFLQDIDFIGSYDPVSPPTFPASGGTVADAGKDELMLPLTLLNQSSNCVLDNVTSSGFSGLILGGNSEPVNANILNDCYCTNWFNYAVFMSQDTRTAIIGCNFSQNPNAVRTRLTVQGGQNGIQYWNQPGDRNMPIHGPLRQTGVIEGVVWACHLDSRTTWAENSPGSLGSEYAACRWMTIANTSAPLQSGHVGRSHLRGGDPPFTAAATSSGGGSSQRGRGMPIVDGCYIELGFNSSEGLQSAYSELTWRNLVIRRPDYGAGQANLGSVGSDFDGPQGVAPYTVGNRSSQSSVEADPTGQRARIQNIVTVIDAAASNSSWREFRFLYTPVAPQVDRSGLIAYAPASGWDSTYAEELTSTRFGIRLQDLDDLDANFRPLSGLPLNEFTYPGVAWDFFGDLRTTSVRGPFEAATDLSEWDDITTNLDGTAKFPAATAVTASATNITDTEDYVLWDFAADDTLTFTQGGTVELRMVGAGGGGGDCRNRNAAAGGGGAGRIITATFTVADDEVLTITVPGQTAYPAAGNNGIEGGNAVVSFGATTYTAQGGGGGGSDTTQSATAGWHGGGGFNLGSGSAGGGGNAGGAGFDGGTTDRNGGGGGGAGGVGVDGVTGKGGNGGAAVTSTFSGTSEAWGGGGGGGIRSWSPAGFGGGVGDATTEGSGGRGETTGEWNDGEDGVSPGWGGGGGNGRNDATNGRGGRGAAGRVQIRYRR